ncbi:MAG: hypothetical protein WC330_01465 [Candidatus Omnitrophota bacterium]|jgi:hypothetical protein
MGFFSNLFGNRQSIAKCKVEFDTNGKVQNIEAPEGQWKGERNGSAQYYTQNVGSLFHANELLKKVNSIPPVTYYVVITPDGSLGRDIQGFYTEAPIKTKNILVEISGVRQKAVESLSLTGFGDMIANHNTVAQLKSQGQYARLVLQMKCGQCGYESPIETEPGSFVRECYCCGTENKCSRGSITVHFGFDLRKVEI